MTGYNLYVGKSSGVLYRQNSSPIAIGTGWTEPDTLITRNGLPPPHRGVGDGNLTSMIAHPTGTVSSTLDREMQMVYDWRDRLIATKSGANLDANGHNDASGEGTGVQRPINFTTLDNLGEPIATAQYDGDAIAITKTAGVPNAPSSSLLRAKNETSFDEQGRDTGT